MGTTTSNLSLYKPAAAEQGWHDSVNANWDTIDALDTGGGYLSTHLHRYVDPINGNDANTGLSPSAAMETIQAAYDDLYTVANANYTDLSGYLGLGKIILLPGDHDVGDGIAMSLYNGVEFVGTRSGAQHYVSQDSSSRIISSSSTATEFFKMYQTGAGTVGRGFRFTDIGFRISSTTNTSLTSVLYVSGMNNFQVERCSFANAQSTATTVWAILHESMGDISWARIFNNNCGHMPFYKATPAAGGGANMNRNAIMHNVCFYGGSEPIIHLNGEWAFGTVAYNTLEGPTGNAAVLVDNSNADWNTFIENCGEGGGATYPFYQFDGGNNNIIIGGMCKAEGGTTGIFAQFATGAFSNTIIANVDYTGQAGYMRKVVDSSTYGNRIVDARWGPKLKYKTGTSPSFTTSDFNGTLPPNGTLAGITYNTSSGVNLLWFVSNGAFASITAP